MHAEKCPICEGEGLLCDIEPESLIGACPRYHVCHGCQGRGWISVADMETEEFDIKEEGEEAAEPELEGEDTEEEEPTEPEFEGEDE